MKILVLNGSPRKNGTVSSLLRAVTESLPAGHEIEWFMLDPNVKTVFPPKLGITAQSRVARAERSLHIAQAKRG